MTKVITLPELASTPLLTEQEKKDALAYHGLSSIGSVSAYELRLEYNTVIGHKNDAVNRAMVYGTNKSKGQVQREMARYDYLLRSIKSELQLR